MNSELTTLRIEKQLIYLLELQNNVDLEKYLLPEEIEKYHQISLEKRQSEFLTTRVIRTIVFGKIPLSYNEYGAPILEGKNISISHGNGFVALAVSEQKVGVDIDFLRMKIERLFDKFGSDEELKWANTPLLQMQLWSIKEAAYKHYQKKRLIFKEQLVVTPVDFIKHSDQFICKVIGDSESYSLNIHSKVYPEWNDLIISITI